MRKYHYFRAEDANRYLSGTIIFHKETKKPIHVASVLNAGPDQQIITYYPLESNVGFCKSVQEEFLADRFEVRNFPSLGYLNVDNNIIGTKAFYLARRPLRDVKQGLYHTNVTVHNPPPLDKRMAFRNFLDSSEYSNPILNLFADIYPSFEEAEEKINANSDSKKGMFSKVAEPNKASPYKSVAVNKRFAVASKWKDGQDSNVLLYKQDEIGYGSFRKGFKISDNFSYLKETVEDARIRIN